MKYREGLTPDELAEHDRCEAAYQAARKASRDRIRAAKAPIMAELAAIKAPMTALRMKGYQRVHRQEKDNVATD
jgi:hypothetical protein